MMLGKGKSVYEKYNQYPELNRLIGAVAVSKQLRQTLLQNPRLILEQGYLGYKFDLTEEEAVLVSSAAGGDIQEFSQQVWNWMDRNGNGHDNPFAERQFKIGEMTGNLFVNSVVPVVPISTRIKTGVAGYSFLSESEPLSWDGRVSMEPLILIVDDNQEMAKGLRFALEMEGFRVVLASDGEAAVDLLNSEAPALILADIRMPRMDGYALLREVKVNAEWRDIPFVFVTAAADWREAVMAKSRGVDEYIVKPFELEDLIAIVNKLTGKAEQVDIDIPGTESEINT